MARHRGRPHFQGAGDILLTMVLLVCAVGTLAYVLSPISPSPNPLLAESFAANPFLNGLILLVLLFGLLYTLFNTASTGRAARWIRAYDDAIDHRRLPSPPALIRPASVILRRHEEVGGGDFDQPLSTALLDSVGVQVDESRELSRYVAGLLVFLGLLGTFWGLLQTVSGIAGVIGELAETSGDGADAVAELIRNLNAPLSGMYTAFSSSLFGLGGSLVVGALDILNGRALNRFYADLEAWLAANTRSATPAPSGPAASLGVDPGRLEEALTALASAQDRGSAGIRQEIRDLGRLLLGGASDSR